MTELALALLLSGWRCPPVECAEIYINTVYSLVCIDGREYEPITGPYDRCIRIDLVLDSST